MTQRRASETLYRLSTVVLSAETTKISYIQNPYPVALEITTLKEYSRLHDYEPSGVVENHHVRGGE